MSSDSNVAAVTFFEQVVLSLDSFPKGLRRFLIFLEFFYIYFLITSTVSPLIINHSSTSGLGAMRDGRGDSNAQRQNGVKVLIVFCFALETNIDVNGFDGRAPSVSSRSLVTLHVINDD